MYMSLALTMTTLMMVAREPDIDKKHTKKSTLQALSEGCAAATSSADLSINNVRARILGSGDMWWDLNDAKYEVPKGSNKHSMFAGALWLGGKDEADQLRLAAMTYRQRGVDYWPGPLSDDNTASITSDVCERYNRHWIIYRDEVETHAAWIACKEDPNCNEAERFPGYTGNVPKVIKEWPGNGIDGELPNKLAPYFESTENGEPGVYDWEWDYPGYDITGDIDCQLKETDLLYGDETIWWVYNDKGNVHTETQAAALGFEIRAQAFAFTSNDEVNNMTFNNYRILNKSTFRLTDTYFGTWFDPDLGNSDDDIIGSDIARGLGYCYNSDNFDEGANGYGENPPAVGFDFFQGPFADYFDGVDNDRDGCVDGVRVGDTCVTENRAAGINERIIMSGFMYYNRRGSGSVPQATTDPSVGEEFYNLLRSRWKDGKPLIIETPSGKGNTNNGDGYVASGNGIATTFAYPGKSVDTTGAYEPKTPIDWWESPANNADKRGLHCAGPFSLAPGALNFITTGTVWARNFGGNDIFASVNDVIVADDKAQQLFDNCFNVLDGPDSPELEIVEMDRELILKLKNAFTPKTIGYEEVDPAIPVPDSLDGKPFNRELAEQTGYNTYRFEGFQIFQVNGPNVSIEDIYDRTQSRLIWQSDIKNDIGQLVNYTRDPDLKDGGLVPQDMTLEANNNGIELTFSLKEDAFAEGDKQLVNNREYYFYVIAYSQNEYVKADPFNLRENSQKEPYLAGRKIGNAQKPYLGIPHKTENTKGGLDVNSGYGDGLPITRFAGAGNSGNFLELTEETREKIAVQFSQDIEELDYLPGRGPVQIKVVDPTAVAGGEYYLTFEGVSRDSKWYIIDKISQDTIATAEAPLSYLGEQIIDELGISVSVRNQATPGRDEENVRNNGVIGGEIVYEDPSKTWFSGVPDDDSYTPTNWILAGNGYIDPNGDDKVGPNYNDIYKDTTINGRPSRIYYDPYGQFETILNGIIAPTFLTSDVQYDPDPVNPIAGYGVRIPRNNVPSIPDPVLVSDLPNIDIVITKDPALWTRVPVFEMGDVKEANEYGTPKFDLREDPTMKISPNGTLEPDYDRTTFKTGWSYFPGYAVNVETGNRLNMAFGENSWLKQANGGDMIWNPTSDMTDKLFTQPLLGGVHVIYVFADSAVVDLNQGYQDITYQGDDISQHPMINQLKNLSSNNKSIVFGGMAWTVFPMVSGPEFEFQNYNQIPTETRVSVRVTRPYQRTDSPSNDGYPQYLFDTRGRQAEAGRLDVLSSALDNIKVVPNPYYGSSEYEDSQLDNVVKITNLPESCTIRIFMTNGTLIRTIDKDNTLAYVEWDLKNDFNVPIASGIYMIHIDAGAAGQKVVKWIGALRPVDLNAF